MWVVDGECVAVMVVVVVVWVVDGACCAVFRVVCVEKVGDSTPVVNDSIHNAMNPQHSCDIRLK
jgi:hypothetical protein